MKQISITDAVKIVNQRVKPFNGEKEYLATGGLVGISVVTEKVTYKNKPSRADLLAREGQLIVARMKETNKVFLVDENISDYIFSTGFLVLEAKDNWNPSFLFHFFQSKYFQRQKNKLSSGATQKAINNEKFKEILIPEITPEDQKRIVVIFDQADILIQKRKQAIELLDKYLKSVFIDIFGHIIKNEKGWNKLPLKELTKKIVDCPHSTPKYSNNSSDHACLRSSDIQNGFIELNDVKYVDEQEYKRRIQRYIPTGGEIIFCREGGRLGNAAIIPRGLNCCLGQRMMLLIANKDMATTEYLWALITSSDMNILISELTGGAAAPRINIKDLIKIPVFKPPLDLQNKYSDIYEETMKLKHVMQTQLKELENNFQSLMQKTFNGELTS
jgi:type I restriction enzyme S subunit